MTAQPPKVKVAPGATAADTQPNGRHPALSELEKMVFPAWLDKDPATGGPSYLGYVALLLIAAVIIQFVLMAIIVATA